MGNCKDSAKSSYFKLLKEKARKSYDQIKANKLRTQNFIKMNKIWIKKFQKNNLTKKINININWKEFVLDQLYFKKNSKEWINPLCNFIESNFNKEMYKFENYIFIGQFCSLNFPVFNNKNMEKTLEFEYEIIDEDIQSEKLLKSNENLISENEIEEESSIRSDYKSKNEQFEKKLISIIKSQLEFNFHLINAIINKFSYLYTDIINNKIKETYDNDIIKKIKSGIIEDIQNFIELMKVTLKLFYVKVINYEHFLDEKDETFNLISSILFNMKNFYQSLFKLFELSNKKKYQDLENKKIQLGELSPKNAGINIKFRLDDETEKLKNDKNYIENVIYSTVDKIQNKKRVFKFFEDLYLDTSIIRINTFDGINKKKEDNIQYMNSNLSNQQKKFSSQKFREFSNNSILSKKEIDVIQLEIPYLLSSNGDIVDHKIPYGKVINYLEGIKNYHLPHDKLKIFALSSKLIKECIEQFWKDNQIPEKNYLDLDADEFMSIYLYIIYNTNLESIYTELDFINYFIADKTKQSKLVYYFATVDACLNFIMSVEKKEDLSGNDF